VDAVIVAALRQKTAGCYKYINICREQGIEQIILDLDGKQGTSHATTADELDRTGIAEKSHRECREIPHDWAQ
jgi:hypothetical protein